MLIFYRDPQNNEAILANRLLVKLPLPAVALCNGDYPSVCWFVPLFVTWNWGWRGLNVLAIQAAL